MTATKIRGPWPIVEQPKPKTVNKPKPAASIFKVVQVPYTHTPQVTGVSIYQAEIDALLKGDPGQTAIECKTNEAAKRFAHAVQRTIKRSGKDKGLRVVTKQTGGGVTLVWVIKREKA
jgi:hypothetical protein